MKIFDWEQIKRDIENDYTQSFFKTGCGISIGSFDGLHKGHRLLLTTLVENCKKDKILSGVVSFKRPLPSVKHSDDYKGDLSTLNQRLKLFENLGIDFAIIVDFDETFASLKGIEFLQMLVNSCNMKYIAEGIDFRCGYKGSTDASSIKYFAENNNIKFDFVENVYYDNGTEKERISSSYIRSIILKRFFSKAQDLLERPYSLEIQMQNDGYVFPKENILQAIPPEGVYQCLINGTRTRVEITSTDIICGFEDNQKFYKGDVFDIEFD
ncbi:MAG: hypothetical protein K6E69_03445 [Treponema sp.]|uniref:hypothetical protein n=1 Tax=Treponema sp. TaxID=166 RepID=UPI00298E5637|nr:hypothetical protein [Treponema sp.]MCR5386154.1 hypothetical protein [Treponema sp.]